MSLKDFRKTNRACPGLTDSQIEDFLKTSPDLSHAIASALGVWNSLDDEIKNKSSDQIVNYLQEHVLNFYAPDSRAPFVPLAGKGPWVVTHEGSVIYETGGYGMLGYGHSPEFIMKEIAKEEVMANVMTASIAQRKATDSLRKAIGIERGGCPYASFAFLNSGSEANNLALRLSDLHASKLKGEKSPVGKKAGLLTLKKGFHGRTESPARVSDSSSKSYKDLPMLGKLLSDVYKVEINDTQGIRAAFDEAKKSNTFICAAIVEPVMGEGNAGYGMSAEFYKELRQVTKDEKCILIIDSIQAGLRAHGVLSFVDYPEMKSLDAPDIETFSKAINGGQFPISVIALSKELADLSNAGPFVYGNTMTTNPKAMNIVTAVVKASTPDLRKNIVDSGKYFLDKLQEIVKNHPDKAEFAQGTGLLLSLKLKPEYPVEGKGGIEEKMRRNGINVIHASGNSLRFTPHFGISRKEVDLIVSVLLSSLS